MEQLLPQTQWNRVEVHLASFAFSAEMTKGKEALCAFFKTELQYTPTKPLRATIQSNHK